MDRYRSVIGSWPKRYRELPSCNLHSLQCLYTLGEAGRENETALAIARLCLADGTAFKKPSQKFGECWEFPEAQLPLERRYTPMAGAVGSSSGKRDMKRATADSSPVIFRSPQRNASAC